VILNFLYSESFSRIDYEPSVPDDSSQLQEVQYFVEFNLPQKAPRAHDRCLLQHARPRSLLDSKPVFEGFRLPNGR
jgi:hypothetical protein